MRLGVLDVLEASPWKAEESFLPSCSFSSGPLSLTKLLLSPKLATSDMLTVAAVRTQERDRREEEQKQKMCPKRQPAPWPIEGQPDSRL